ncbi:hypothetical protein Syun_025560 [Stephania yunnanensis]|uniref:Uncharacterized protein n=1 Tax=Stephania yunnanensis TaxID=152371 RepID=A0AAP0ERV6_9MAGN
MTTAIGDKRSGLGRRGPAARGDGHRQWRTVYSIGPRNSQFVESVDRNSWDAKDVADGVLFDKSTLRVTSAQRLAESSILDTHTTKVSS